MNQEVRRTAVFSPEAVASINRAYASALDILGSEGASPELKTKLAEHLMYLARNGEKDEHRLCSLAVIRTIGRPPKLAAL